MEHSISASTSTEAAGQFVAQLSADAVRVIEEHAGNELYHCGANSFVQLLCDRPSRRASDDQLIRFSSTRRRRTQRLHGVNAAHDVADRNRRLSLDQTAHNITVAEHL
jgi:hypothetical protein